jgi:hypothetical protein
MYYFGNFIVGQRLERASEGQYLELNNPEAARILTLLCEQRSSLQLVHRLYIPFLL